MQLALVAHTVARRPVILTDWGFHRASFIARLDRHGLDYVVRTKKGSCITEKDGGRWRLGEEGLKVREMRFVEGMRYRLYHDRPRKLSINVALCWKALRAERETLDASNPKSTDIRPRASMRPKVPLHDTSKGGV